MTCPDCQGKGCTVADHVRYADGSGGYNVPLRCSRCLGDGDVCDDMAEWIAEGERMRADRLARNTGLRSEAKRRGMSPSELSAMEFGRVKPVPEN